MRRSTERILVSHAGTLPRPTDLTELRSGGNDNQQAYLQRLPSAVREVVERQAQVGIDIVNDGELSKSNFTNYVRDRLGGIEPATEARRKDLPPRNINARDVRE